MAKTISIGQQHQPTLTLLTSFRVGRTARAGKAGRSIAFVTQYDVEAYQRLESLIGRTLPAVSDLPFFSSHDHSV
jgi:superfamily II DNA/RNA helicase